MKKIIQDEEWCKTYRSVFEDTSDAELAVEAADLDALKRQYGLDPLRVGLSEE